MYTSVGTNTYEGLRSCEPNSFEVDACHYYGPAPDSFSKCFRNNRALSVMAEVLVRCGCHIVEHVFV